MPTSNEGKALITRILHLNPAFRPSLDDILGHEFFHQGNIIPKLLPTSTLACAPSNVMLKQFTTQSTTGEKPFTSRNEGGSEDMNLNNVNIEIANGVKNNANTERIPRKENDKLDFLQNRPNTVRDSKEEKDKGGKDSKDKGMRTLAMSV